MAFVQHLIFDFLDKLLSKFEQSFSGSMLFLWSFFLVFCFLLGIIIIYIDPVFFLLSIIKDSIFFIIVKVKLILFLDFLWSSSLLL